MIAQMSKYLSSGDQYVEDVASEIVKIEEMYDEELISDDERKALMEDAMELAIINEEMEKLETEIKIDEMYKLLKNVLKII